MRALPRTREGVPTAIGGLVSVVVAVVLYTRYSINGVFGRDEGIYVYAGQRMAHGTAPYASIFDAKTPLASMVCAAGAGIARLFGRNDLLTMRFGFFVLSVLTVLAIHLLVTRLWHSAVGGVVSAVVFASFDGFAHDALAGPDAKTPGVFSGVVSMWLVTCQRWFLAGFFGSLAFLAWQPFGIYAVMAIIAAGLMAEGERKRAFVKSVVGAIVPLAATAVYFLVEGAFGDFFEGAFRFPFGGVQRGNETVDQRWHRIREVVSDYYHLSGKLFWIGNVVLLVLVIGSVIWARSNWRGALASPLVVVVLVTGLAEFAYALHDFQGYPDVFPLLPYPAIGLGGAIAVLLAALRKASAQLAWRAGAVAALVLAVLLACFSFHHFDDAKNNNSNLSVERAAACAMNKAVLPHTTLYSLGDPVPLVLTHRTNPDRYIYLTSGVDRWKVNHLKGGFQAWTQQIKNSRFSVIVVNSWPGGYHQQMTNWLKSQHYPRGYFGHFRVFLSLDAKAELKANGLKLTPAPTTYPRTAAGHKFAKRNC